MFQIECFIHATNKIDNLTCVIITKRIGVYCSIFVGQYDYYFI